MMKQYKCVETFYIPLLDEHENEVENEEVKVEKDSVWEKQEKSWISDVRLESDSGWLEIDEEIFRDLFQELEGAANE